MFKTSLLILMIAASAFAQSRRVGPSTAPELSDARSVKQLFEEANSYANKEFEKLANEGAAYDEELRDRIVREQKELAGRHAARAAARADLKPEDRYYIGLLHWISENLAAANETLKAVIGQGGLGDEDVQVARSVVVIASAKRKEFADAERFLADYTKSLPNKPRERFRMESELAAAYLEADDFDKAAMRGNDALQTAKFLFGDPVSRTTAVDRLLEAGLTLFSIHKQAGKKADAVKALDDLRTSAIFGESSIAYYIATDELIKFLIDDGRKPEALKIYEESVRKGYRDFATEPVREDARRRLERRKRHYEMLMGPAPELVDIVKTMNGDTKTLAQLKGKVVLIDFWATWCGPCFEAFPYLNAWRDEFKDDLVVIGLTRFYGLVAGKEVGAAKELEYLTGFVADEKLRYEIAVADGITNQLAYDAMNLPTAVLIDRNGMVRYVEIGTNKARLEQIRAKIKELVDERPNQGK